jgi:SET domain
MTEVRQVTSGGGGGSGVYATRRFEVGDVIFRETASSCWKLPAADLGGYYQQGWLKNESSWSLPIVGGTKKTTAAKGGEVKDAANIRAQDCFKGGSNKKWKPREQSKLACMLLSILRFVDETTTRAEERQWLLGLYHPSLNQEEEAGERTTTIKEEETEIITLSHAVLEWLDSHVRVLDSSSTTTSSSMIDDTGNHKNKISSSSSSSSSKNSNPLATALRDDRESLQRIALVWACNAFAGGRIYQRHSRLNHSCQPNAVVQTRQGGGGLPNHKNNNTKDGDDDDDNDDDEQWIRATAAIEIGDEVTISYLPIEYLYSDTSFRRSILRDTKYFHCHCIRCDDRVEQFVTAIPCIKCHPRTRQGMLDEDVQYDDDVEAPNAVHYAWMVPASSANQHAPSATATRTTEYRCSSCQYVFPNDNSDDDRILRTHQVVSAKIAAFLRSYQHQESIAADEGDASNVLMEYTSLSSSVHGALFWTTNVLLYYQLDASLQEYHRRLLADTSQEPDLDQIAEFIDMLQRLCRFVKHAQLPLHRGHWLGDVIIGTARALVALGDRKSQKYASDWLTEDDFGVFVQRFEPDDLQTVVERLRTVWSRTDTSTNDNNDNNSSPNNKRLKTGLL